MLKSSTFSTSYRATGSHARRTPLRPKNASSCICRAFAANKYNFPGEKTLQRRADVEDCRHTTATRAEANPHRHFPLQFSSLQHVLWKNGPEDLGMDFTRLPMMARSSARFHYSRAARSTSTRALRMAGPLSCWVHWVGTPKSPGFCSTGEQRYQ